MGNLVGAKVESKELIENNKLIFEAKDAAKNMNGCISVQP